ncbi:MAG: DUF2569 family protein [Candidatus Latescibacter sp.]|nr:DUF2569 family protein [Candidatus Latescibacter sp.]
MNFNQNQKLIIVSMIVLIIVMLMYPPFHLVNNNGISINKGYGWIIDPPGGRATVNVSMLLIQWVGVLLVGGLALFLSKNSKEQPQKLYKQGPSGVGGFLLFLIAGMIVIGPILGAGSISRNIIIIENQYPGLKVLLSNTSVAPKEGNVEPAWQKQSERATVDDIIAYEKSQNIQPISMPKVPQINKTITPHFTADDVIAYEKSRQAQINNQNLQSADNYGTMQKLKWGFVVPADEEPTQPKSIESKEKITKAEKSKTSTSESIYQAWGNFKLIVWVTFLLFAALSIYGGLGLAQGKDRSVVTRAKVILWVSGPIATILMGFMIPKAILGVMNPDFVGGLFTSVITAGIWTAYLSKSKRVINTYGQ